MSFVLNLFLTNLKYYLTKSDQSNQTSWYVYSSRSECEAEMSKLLKNSTFIPFTLTAVSIANCIYCTVYCQDKYSMKILQHLLSISELYSTVDVMHVHPVYHLRV